MNSPLTVLALIPARGGSKSVPRKNLLPMLGRPLIAWSIQHGLDSRHVCRTIVSTDDEEIADVSRHYGAEVPFMRPAELAQDLSPDIETFQHALRWLQKNEGYTPDLVVHLRPTGPARRVAEIDSAIELLYANPTADSLRAVSLAAQTPFKMWFLNADGTMRPVLTLEGVKEAHSMARQMLPKVYRQNGYVDIVRSRTVLEKCSMVGDQPLAFVIDHPVSDVDYLDDIPQVEAELRTILDGSVKNISQVSYDRHPA